MELNHVSLAFDNELTEDVKAMLWANAHFCYGTRLMDFKDELPK